MSKTFHNTEIELFLDEWITIKRDAGYIHTSIRQQSNDITNKRRLEGNIQPSIHDYFYNTKCQ